MSRLTIDTGTAGNPATGDSLRGAFTKVNTNFAELYAELGGDSLDAISFTNNTISTDITNANLILTGNGTGGVVIEDIEITGSTVNVLTTNNNLTLNTNGTGKVVINGLSFPTTDGTAGQVLKTDGAGNLSFTAVDPGAITIVGDDSTGTAVNIGETFKIAGAGTVTTAVSGDTITITGSAGSTGDFTFSGNILSTASSNADMELDPAGTGNLVLKSGNFLPQTDDTQDLGSASKRWRDLYVGPGTVKVGDESTGLQYGSAGVYSGDGGTLIMRIDPPDGAGTHYVAFDESVREIDMSQAEVRVRDILPPQDAYGNTQTDISVGSMRVRDEYDFSTASPLLLTPENTNQDLALSPNGTGRVEIQSRDTVLGHSGADTFVRLTTKLNKDLVLDTQSGSNSGTITIPSGENSDISIQPNGTGEVSVTTNSNEFVFKSNGSFELPSSIIINGATISESAGKLNIPGGFTGTQGLASIILPDPSSLPYGGQNDNQGNPFLFANDTVFLDQHTYLYIQGKVAAGGIWAGWTVGTAYPEALGFTPATFIHTHSNNALTQLTLASGGAGLSAAATDNIMAFRNGDPITTTLASPYAGILGTVDAQGSSQHTLTTINQLTSGGTFTAQDESLFFDNINLQGNANIVFADSTTQSTAASLIMVGDDSTGTTFNAGETVKIAGTQNITTAVSGDTLTITGPNLTIPGPFSDDAAAAAGGVAVGRAYHKTGTGGQMFVRLS